MGRDESSDRRRGGRTRVTRGATLVALVLVAGLVLASVATPVAAHASLSESDPANGEQVETVPEDVTLSFSGDGVQNADVSVTGPDGEDVSGDAEIDPDDTRIVTVPLEASANGDDAEGMYTVQWEVLADDGHTTSGSFFFSVGDEPLDRDAVLESYEVGDEGTDDSVPPLESAAKGLLLVALVGLVGSPVTAAVAVYPVAGRLDSSARSVDRRLTWLFAATSAVLLLSVIALGLAQALSVGSLSIGTVLEFLEMPLGRAWLGQLAASALVVLTLTLALAGVVSRPVWLGGTFLGAIGVGAAVSWTSHSATAIDRAQGTAVDFAHIGGAGLWVGGLVVLSLVVPPLLRDARPADRATLAAGVIRRYSLLAFGGVTLAGATGLALAAWHVSDLEALGATVYGTALSAKTLLVLLALGLGGFTRFVLLRRLEPSERSDRGDLVNRPSGSGGDGSANARLREDGGQSETTGTVAAFTRAVRLEVGILVLVLLVSGLLTSVPTAAVVGGDDGPETATIEREGDVNLELTALPATNESFEDGEAGLIVQTDEPVVFEVAFTDGDGERLESDRTVRLTADGPEDTFDVDLEHTDDGTYATVQTLPGEGDWDVRITGEPDGQYVSEWVDVHVAPGSDGHDENHHGDEEHDHDSEHEHEEHASHGDEERDSPLVMTLQFGAVAVGVVGSVAVAVEAVRFRDRRD